MKLRNFIFFALVCLLIAACGDDSKKKAKDGVTEPTNNVNNVNNLNNTNNVNNANNLNNANNVNNLNNANNVNNANNMSACGDGVIDDGEACDSGIPTGPGSCPNSCDNGDACTIGQVSGTAAACTATCVYAEITACQNNDGCCPSQCNSATDNDCSATCGDGIIDEGETCDGNCPTMCQDQSACTTDRLTGSADNCNAACRFDPVEVCQSGDGCCPDTCNANNDSDCVQDCGNGVIEAGETCDGNCPSSCDDGLVCTADAISGSPNTCNVVCSNTPISACQSGDGCCPSGCTYPTDLDCMCQPAVCGSVGRECGSPNDGCSGTLNCGSCPSGQQCQNFSCVNVNPTDQIGEACNSVADCGPGEICGENPNYQGGFCSKDCQFDNDCPGGSHCASKDANGVGQCMPNCLADNDCRAGYECYNFDDDQNSTKECAPSGVGSASVGAYCNGVYECSGSTSAWCLNATTASANYCSVSCNALVGCPTGAVCNAGLLGIDGWCVQDCATMGCRAGFSCQQITNLLGSTVNGCVAN